MKMKSRRARAGRRGGARMSTVDCAREYRRLRAFPIVRSRYGESTFKRNRPSFAVLMVLGGGGGVFRGPADFVHGKIDGMHL